MVFPLFQGVVSAASEDSPRSFFGQVILRIEYDVPPPFDRSRYDPLLKLKRGDMLTRTGVKDDVQTLYDTGQFSSIVILASQEEGGVALCFKLGLNTYFNLFSFQGAINLEGRTLFEAITLPLGDRFTLERLEDARRAVLGYLSERGFYQAKVQATTQKDENRRMVNTHFLVERGELATIRSIEVEGVPSAQSKAVRERLGFHEGRRYERRRIKKRLVNVNDYFRELGYLTAAADLKESWNPIDNTVALVLKVANLGKARIVVEGSKIERDQLRRLLPIMSGAGVDADLIQEGVFNLHEYLEDRGYPEAEVTFTDEVDEHGVRWLRYRVDPGRKVTVEYVEFQGNHAVTTQDLLGAIQIQPARFLQNSIYSVAKLDSDQESLRVLYNTRGYLEARIIPLLQSLDNGNKVGITFECEEGRLSRVRALILRGNHAIRSDVLQVGMKTKVGDVYSPHFLELDRQAILAAYNDAGFLRAKVNYSAGAADATGEYPINFDIEEETQARVDSVLVLGNERTRASVVQRRIKLEERDPISLGKMLETQQALYRMGIFDFVRVSPQDPGSPSPLQNVVVRLADTKQFTIRYGLGYQERERLRGTLQLSDLNTFGTGRRTDLQLRVSRLDQGITLTFSQPQIRYLPVESYFTIAARRKSDISFDSLRANLSYQFSRPLSGHSWALMRYNFRNVRLSNIRVSPSEIGREDNPRNLSTFSAIYVNDSRDDYVDPEKGFFTSTDLSVTTKLIGSNDYFSLFSQNSYYRKLPASTLMAASLRVGLAKPFGGDTDIPISERFFAGGSSSLRGFDTDHAGPSDSVTGQPLGGNALLVSNWELRVPLFRSLHLAGFYDIGNVFRNISSIRFSGLSHTAGIGVRLKTPLGPLRADYGFNLNLPEALGAQGFARGHFYFTIGPPF